MKITFDVEPTDNGRFIGTVEIPSPGTLLHKRWFVEQAAMRNHAELMTRASASLPLSPAQTEERPQRLAELAAKEARRLYDVLFGHLNLGETK